MNKNILFKMLLIFGMIIYMASPLDLFPGPIDDFIIIAAGLMKLKNRPLYEYE